MTVVLVVAAVLAYLAIGVVTARLMHRQDQLDPDDGFEALVVTVGWPIVLIMVGFSGMTMVLGMLVTTPTRQQRRERWARREQAEADALAREYGLPTVGETPEQRRAREQGEAARAVRTGRGRRPVLPGEQGVADGR